MKTLRHVLLSVLLSAFGFFVVHDYVIADVDTDTQYELCKIDSENRVLDLPSQIHEHIHTLLSVPECEPKAPLKVTDTLCRLIVSETAPSYISPIPAKPPIF